MGDSRITTPMEERFWRRVDKDGPVPPKHPDLGPCWLWLGRLDKRSGYGKFRLGVRGSPSDSPHRIAYRLLVGAIPAGYHVHHRCDVTGCVRPEHLEVLTPGEHLMKGNTFQAKNAAKTHCLRGHPFNAENTAFYLQSRGTGFQRACKACRRIRDNERYLRSLACD